METKSILQSKRSWFNYGSIILLALTAIFADEEFANAIKEHFGFKGAIGLMVGGAVVNQFLAQISTERPTFQLPKKKDPKSNLDILNEKHQSDDNYLSKY